MAPFDHKTRVTKGLKCAPLTGPRGFDQHIQRKHRGQRVGQQGHAVVTTTDALGHDAGAYDGAEQGGGADELGHQLLGEAPGRQSVLLRVPRPLCGLLLDLRRTLCRPGFWCVEPRFRFFRLAHARHRSLAVWASTMASSLSSGKFTSSSRRRWMACRVCLNAMALCASSASPADGSA